MSSDAQIARMWASKALENDLLDEVPLVGYRAAARHILATTTPPTMADVEWDDAVHAGLCAEHPDYGPVRMTSIDVDGDIWFLTDKLRLHFNCPDYLTPIPGTRVDLTPRREPESTPEPEQAPTHPTTLVTEDDYRGAPYGTVVWGNGPSSNMRSSLEKYGNAWLEAGDDGTFTPRDMAAAGPHQVLRWGEAL